LIANALSARYDRRDVQAVGHEFLVAGIDDLIRLKRAAGRPKDRVELELLGALRGEIDGASR
jgi:hypothetical protein